MHSFFGAEIAEQAKSHLGNGSLHIHNLPETKARESMPQRRAGRAERSWTPSRLEALQNAAVQAIAAYTDSIVSQAETQILRNALRGSVSRAAWRWVVGALLYTFIIVGVVVGLSRSGIDLSALLTR